MWVKTSILRISLLPFDSVGSFGRGKRDFTFVPRLLRRGGPSHERTRAIERTGAPEGNVADAGAPRREGSGNLWTFVGAALHLVLTAKNRAPLLVLGDRH